MVWTTVNEGKDTLANWTGLMAGDKKDSADNPYLDWLNDMRVTFYEEADYGNDSEWTGAGGGVDVLTTFPGSPSKGVSFLRKNTNGASGLLRLYIFEGSTWEYRTISDGEAPEMVLDNLGDVTISAVADLELFQYDSASSNWRNRTFAEVAYPFDDIGNPDADVNFNFGVNHFHLIFTAPTTEAGVILELLGNTSGRDLLHLHQTTGNPTGETRLIHLEWSDPQVVPMRWMSETSAFHLYFDMETLTVADKTVTFPNATGIVALTSDLHTEYTDEDAVNAIEAVSNAAIATGDSLIFKDVTDGVLKQDLVSDLIALHDPLGGTFVEIWLPMFPNSANNMTSAGATWGGGSIVYIFGSGGTGSVYWDLSRYIPYKFADKLIELTTIKAYFWTGAVVTANLTRIAVSLGVSSPNRSSNSVGTDSTFTGGVLEIAPDHEMINDQSYYYFLTGFPNASSNRLVGLYIKYKILA